MKRKLILAAAVALSLSAFSASPGFKVLQKFPVGGEGGWDYLTVDSQARRLYVSHATQVLVLGLDDGKRVGEISDTQGVHGIALAPELNRGFISCGKADQAVIFDLKSLKVLGSVKTGENPDAILYDAPTRRVFTFNGRSKDATVFDAATGKVEATLPLGGKPEFAVSDGKGEVYVNIEDKSEVAEIDAAKLKLLRRFSLSPGEEPSGLALDAKGGLLFSGCANKVMTVLDLKSGKVVATLPIGEGVDGNGFDPGTGLAFSANGEGTLTVAQQTSLGKFAVIQTIPTQRGARTMAIDLATHRIYLPTAQFGPPPLAPTPENPRGRPPILKDTFVILVVDK